MEYTSILDIVGPSMVGPSSSHTAGAARLALLASKIHKTKPTSVVITLYNSFAKTGKGHGTDKAIIGGLLGFKPDDERIKESFKLAKENGLSFEFRHKVDENRHPNAVDFWFVNAKMAVSGNSLGAGKIVISHIDGFHVELRGDYPTLLLAYKDQPGMLRKITEIIEEEQVNIASLNCDRSDKGETAFMSICLDNVLRSSTLERISNIESIYYSRNFDTLEK